MSEITSTLVPIAASTVVAATPLVYAALGETIVEKAGVLNLGVEGMMLGGAVTGFAVALGTGSLTAGFIAGAAAGTAMSLIFAFLTLSLQTNQVATGLALTLFGIGFSAFVGTPYVGKPIAGHQLVQELLADTAVDVDAGRMLTWLVADLLDRGEPMSLPASKAKLFTSEAAVRAVVAPTPPPPG